MIKRVDRQGTAVLEMRREPANALDTRFASALAGEIETALEEPHIGSVVLTGSGTAFSAGVDLVHLLSDGRDGLPGFLAALDRLFRLPRTADKPVVACINGHAIAGGCILAASCDYRVLADGTARLGLPELRVGVPFPPSAFDVVLGVVPRKHLREVVLLGGTYGPRDALERGLADEVVPAEAALARALDVAAGLAAVPGSTYRVTKRMLATRSRGGGSGDLAGLEELEAEIEGIWASDEIRERIADYVEETLGKRI